MRAIICIFLIFVCCIFTASALDDYDYYQSISYSACDQEIYQQDIVIHRTTGDPYEESSGGLNITHLYLNDHSQANYGDIRFTNPAGDELSYYLWSDFDSESAKFCVRLEGADAAGDLQVWYGNPAASTTSDGDATFELFDEFNGLWPTYSGSPYSGYPKVVDGEHDANSAISLRSTNNGDLVVKSPSLVGIGGKTVVWRQKNTLYTPWSYHAYMGIRLYNTAGSIVESKNFIDPPHRPTTWTTETWTPTQTGDVHVAFWYWDNEWITNIDWILVRAYSATPPTASDFSGEINAGYVRSYPGYNIPTDPDADGLYEDVNGNGRLDFQDIMIFFQYNAWAKANQPKVECWDWSGNGAIEFSDVQAFWEAEFT